MRGLDYRSVVGQEPGVDPEASAYVLHLGPVELEPISYSTLLALQDCPSVVREVLDLCFTDSLVMWADPADLHPGSYKTRLIEVEASLAAIDRRFKSADRPCFGVLARVVELWQGLTLEAVRQLEKMVDSEAGVSASGVLGDYRRSAFPCVKALLELLPEDDESLSDARQRFEQGTAWLESERPADLEQVEDAGWHKTEVIRNSEDQSFVTWGIP